MTIVTRELRGEQLLLLLRAGQEQAYRRVLAELRARGGAVRETAAALGVGYRSLYRAAERDPAFGERFRRAIQGRQGSIRAALQSRGITGNSGSQKKRAK